MLSTVKLREVKYLAKVGFNFDQNRRKPFRGSLFTASKFENHYCSKIYSSPNMLGWPSLVLVKILRVCSMVSGRLVREKSTPQSLPLMGNQSPTFDLPQRKMVFNSFYLIISYSFVHL